MSDSEANFDFEGFYKALDATREARDLTWKEVANEASVSASTLARMPQNRRPDADGLASLSAWSGLNPGDFVYAAKASAPETLAEVSRLLRQDPNLEGEQAATLEDIFRAAYVRMQQNSGSGGKK